MVNERGGVAGRKIKYIYYDDGFQLSKTVEQVRRLVESDGVAFLFSMLGTATGSTQSLKGAPLRKALGLRASTARNARDRRSQLSRLHRVDACRHQHAVLSRLGIAGLQVAQSLPERHDRTSTLR